MINKKNSIIFLVLLSVSFIGVTMFKPRNVSEHTDPTGITIVSDEIIKDVSNIGVPSTTPSSPAPFKSFAVKTTPDEFNRMLESSNNTILQPTVLPKDLENTCVYMSPNVKDFSGVTVMVYSANQNQEIATAEMTIEIFPVNGPIFNEESSGEFIKLNELDVYINTKAGVGFEEYQAKYGPTAVCLSVYIKPYNYLIRAEPGIPLEELLVMVESLTS